MSVSLEDFAHTASGANSLEGLTRDLLALIRASTGLESAYLTHVDEERRSLSVLYACNALPEAIEVPEGMTVPWTASVCRRALADGTPHTSHADTVWGDVPAVPGLGLRTYLSAPMRTVDGELVGTLCAVSDRRVEVTAEAVSLVTLCARLLTRAFEREWLLQRLNQRPAALAGEALRDALTGVAGRRALLDEIGRALAHATREGGHVVVAFIDLDGFKTINDLHGHLVGDRLLTAVAGQLAAATRTGELLGRYGGDEFVVVGRSIVGRINAATMRERLSRATCGRFALGEVGLDYAGASVGTACSEPGDDVETLLGRADTAMYAVKRDRAALAGPSRVVAPR